MEVWRYGGMDRPFKFLTLGPPTKIYQALVSYLVQYKYLNTYLSYNTHQLLPLSSAISYLGTCRYVV